MPERRRASIEAMLTGAAIFTGIVGYSAVSAQMPFYLQVASESVLGLLVIGWLGVFATPATRSVWGVLRERIRGKSNPEWENQSLGREIEQVGKVVVTGISTPADDDWTFGI